MNINKDKMSYAIVSRAFGVRIDVLDEWIKWLSYINEKDISFLESAGEKSLDELSTEDIARYLEIKKQIKMRDLFVKYKNRTCTKEEHDKVFDYMHKSIDQLISKSMSEEEKKQANEAYELLKTNSSNALDIYIENGLEDYNSLGKIDSFLLRKISIYRYNQITDETNKKILRDKLEREDSLRRSLVKDFGHKW